MKYLFKILFLLLVFYQGPVVLAQQMAEESKVPREKMQKIQAMQGIWDTTGYSLVDGQWQKTVSAVLKSSPRLKGLLLSEQVLTIDPDSVYKVEAYFTYDQYAKRYQVAKMNDRWGQMEIYSGDFTSANTLVVSNLNQALRPLNPEFPYFRISYIQESANTRYYHVEKTTDLGKSWHLVFKETLVKRL